MAMETPTVGPNLADERLRDPFFASSDSGQLDS